MQPFKHHTTTSKNLHLEHLEDQVLNRGVAGALESINFLKSLQEMLSGHGKNPINITTKWDGAPSIICGINPENGKFFVGTKSVFAKAAKLNYTYQDIIQNHDSIGLRAKLWDCLQYLPELGIKTILQGDVLFTQGEQEVNTIEGEKYLTFTPNTLTYAFPVDSVTAKRIHRAKIGIIFHTEYRGLSMLELEASFNIDIGPLSYPINVWWRDASFVDQTGTSTFTEDEMLGMSELILQAVNILASLNGKVLNQMALNTTYRSWLKIFNNSKIREGQSITDTITHTNDFIHWVDARLTAEIGEAKMPETQRKRTQEKTTILGFFRAHAEELKQIFDLINALNSAKMMIVDKLGQVQSTHTFLKTSTGYKVTKPEGFVAVDHIGNAVKLVDRLEFSHANFSPAKDWKK